MSSCDHIWKLSHKYSSPGGSGSTLRHQCQWCNIWAYSNPPFRIEPTPYRGRITEPDPEWEYFSNDLSMQAMNIDYQPPDEFELRDSPIGWSPPDEWTDLD